MASPMAARTTKVRSTIRAVIRKVPAQACCRGAFGCVLAERRKAFGQIIKSRFILRYIRGHCDEKQLNKAEFAYRFTRAVAGNARENMFGKPA